jgi:hypothetical protein
MATGHLTLEACRTRFPRLVRAAGWAAVLNPTEAAAAIRDYRDARDGRLSADLLRWGGGEAVCHFGGPAAVVRAAIGTRRQSRVGSHRFRDPATSPR